MTMFWIWISILMVWSSYVESYRSTTVSFSDSTCELGSTFHSIYTNKDYYLTWDGSPLPDTGGCRMTFDPMDASSEVCVEVETFAIQDCSVHVHYYDENDLKKTYGCGQIPEKFCGSQNADIDVELSNTRTLLSSSNSFRLRVFAHKEQDYTWIIGLVVVVVVTALIAVATVIICRRRRSQGLVFQRSEIPHTRLVNSASSDPSPLNVHPPPPYPANEAMTTEYTVTVPVIVNTR